MIVNARNYIYTYVLKFTHIAQALVLINVFHGKWRSWLERLPRMRNYVWVIEFRSRQT